MPHAALSAAIARTGAALAASPAPDGELLRRFVRSRDEAAFAGLVRTLGPMVLGVCRRVAGDSHLADDAFQAAFLVLARRAADVRPREAVRGWLYGVAVRVAREARTVSARRRSRECPVPVLPDRAAERVEPPDADALRVLDEEVAALPDHLRTAVVLCELDGLPRKEAAGRLGVAEGTLSSRLAKARKVLADRLRTRGVAVPAAGLGALLTASPVSARLAATTSGLLTADPTPAAVAVLTKGVFRTMYLQKLALGCLAAVAAACLFAADAKPGPSPTRPPAPVPVLAPAPPREGVIVVTSFPPAPAVEVFTPDGKSLAKPPVGAAASPINPGENPVCPLWGGRLSPNAKRLAAIKIGPIPQNPGPWTPNHLWVFDLEAKDGPTEPLASGVRQPACAWSPDGTKLYVSHVDPAKDNVVPPKGELVPLVCWVYDSATKLKTPLPVPTGHAVMDVSPDGKTLLTVEVDLLALDGGRAFLVPLDTLKPRPLTEGVFNARRFSPDGKWVLGNRTAKEGKVPLAAVPVGGGAERTIPLVDGATWAMSVCWSPDGKRIAYHWQEEVPPPPGAQLPAVDPPKFYANCVTVADLDGRNAKTIIRDARGQVMSLDWK